MARQRVRRQPRSHTREELLQAAARVFAHRGFHGASVEAVSEEAGFSTGALYSNFKSKEELFLALYEDRVQRRRHELERAVTSASELRAGIASAVGDVAALIERDSEWFLLYFEFLLHAARDPAFARRFVAVRDEGLAQLANGITEGLSRAALESTLDPSDLARALRALSYGLAADRLVDGASDPDPLLPRVFQLIFRGLRAEAAARAEQQAAPGRKSDQ